MERAMEQLNRLTRSLRRARTVELPDGEREGWLGVSGGGRGGLGGGAGARLGQVDKLTQSGENAHSYFS